MMMFRGGARGERFVEPEMSEKQSSGHEQGKEA